MRVSVSHHTVTKGRLFKKTYYEVQLSIALSHEEKQVIKQRGLTKTKLLDRRPADARTDDRDEQFELRVSDLLNGRVDRFLCATPAKAKIYEEDLLEVVTQMKAWIGDNTETGTRTVIEL